MVDAAIEDAVRRALAEIAHDKAASILIRGYGARILGYMRGVVRDEGLADDAFSYFGESVWRGIAAFRGDATALAWAYSVAWRAVCRVLDSGYRRRRAALPTSEAERLVGEVRTATQPYKRTEVKDAIARLREQLGNDEQTLLFLRIDQDLSWNDIASVMETDAVTLRKRFERIKDKLRTLAEQAGLLEA